MKLTFRMTGEEYYLGWKYKRKKGKMNNGTVLMMVTLIAVTIVLAIALNLSATAVILLIIGAGASIAIAKTEKKSLAAQYTMSKYLNGDNTIRLFDEGIEIFNSYQKIYVPWQSVFAVKNDSRYLYILPTYSKGIFVIDKIRYKSEELDKIIEAIKAHISVEEGR